MYKSKLAKALHQVMEDECKRYRKMSEKSVHIFSENFEISMKKLIRKTNKPYFPLINTGFKRAAACVIICAVGVLAVSTQTVDSNRDGYGNFAVNFNSYGQNITDIRTIGTGDYPETLEEHYEITYDLSEYEIIGTFEEDTRYDIDYIKKNGDIIGFSQCTDSRMNVGGNTPMKENKVYPIKVHDYEGIYFLSGIAVDRDLHAIFWHNDRYVFSVHTNISKEEALKIAESVKEIEE